MTITTSAIANLLPYGTLLRTKKQAGAVFLSFGEGLRRAYRRPRPHPCPINNRPPQSTIVPWGNGTFMFDQIDNHWLSRIQPRVLYWAWFIASNPCIVQL